MDAASGHLGVADGDGDGVPPTRSVARRLLALLDPTEPLTCRRVTTVSEVASSIARVVVDTRATGTGHAEVLNGGGALMATEWDGVLSASTRWFTTSTAEAPASITARTLSPAAWLPSVGELMSTMAATFQPVPRRRA